MSEILEFIVTEILRDALHGFFKTSLSRRALSAKICAWIFLTLGVLLLFVAIWRNSAWAGWACTASFFVAFACGFLVSFIYGIDWAEQLRGKVGDKPS